MTQEYITALNDESFLSSNEIITRKEYFNLLKNTKSVISPFGYGEICIRDFKSFIYNSRLIKPDMSQIKTWPNYYIKDITYIPLNWDFSNFFDIVHKLDSNPDFYEKIADNAKNIFFENCLINKNAKINFVNHFIDVLKINIKGEE